MIDLILAQKGGGDDWIQFIVVIAVIGISVLGQVSKVLIKKFSPEKGEQKGQGKMAPLPGPPPAGGGVSRPPVARPRTPRTTTVQPARPARL